MYEDLIVRRSLADLEQASAEGTPFYSCERFEDSYGRLMVGVGMRLEGRALERVARAGRKSVYVSPAPLCDGAGLRSALRRMSRSQADGDKAGPPLPRSVRDALRAVGGACAEVVALIERLRPHPRDLAHGIHVAAYARRLAKAMDRIRRGGFSAAVYPYPARTQREVFTAGLVHDIGRWRGLPTKGHEARGADLLREMAGQSARIQSLADIVMSHHRPLPELCVKGWGAHKTVPVALAEAIVEFPGSRNEAIRQLVPEQVTEETRTILAGLCNLEGAMPPQAVVRLRAGGSAELAVSLRAPADVPEPCLLRFARLEGGRLAPLPRTADNASKGLSYLTAPGHPACEGKEREVVALLTEPVYARMFGRYECLAPAFRAAMDRRAAR